MKNDLYTIMPREKFNELYHYGVKGMKWGVRKKQVKAAPVSGNNYGHGFPEDHAVYFNKNERNRINQTVPLIPKRDGFNQTMAQHRNAMRNAQRTSLSNWDHRRYLNNAAVGAVTGDKDYMNRALQDASMMYKRQSDAKKSKNKKSDNLDSSSISKKGARVIQGLLRGTKMTLRKLLNK